MIAFDNGSPWETGVLGEGVHKGDQPLKIPR